MYAICMDLNKLYETLDRDICLEILEGYSVGPWALRFLLEYWYRLWMVARAGGYYRAAFKSFWGVT